MRDLERRLEVVETLLTERRATRPSWPPRRPGDAVFAYGGDGLVNEVLNGSAGRQAARGGGRRAHERARACAGLPDDPAPPFASGGSRSAASTAGGSPSRRESASTRKPSASWRRGSGWRTAGGAATSPTRGWSRVGCSAGTSRGSRSRGSAGPRSCSSRTTRCSRTQARARSASARGALRARARPGRARAPRRGELAALARLRVAAAAGSRGGRASLSAHDAD